MAYRETETLPAGKILSVTADANTAGSVRRLAASGSSTNYPTVAVAASTTGTFGPFSTNRKFELISEPGRLTHTIDDPSETREVVATIAADGAITIAQGVLVITKSASAAALTLAAPTAEQGGTVMHITSRTAKAHVITATGLLADGVTGGAKDLATFAAFAGASISIVADNLVWNVLSLNAVVVSAAA